MTITTNRHGCAMVVKPPCEDLKDQCNPGPVMRRIVTLLLFIGELE